MYLTRIDFNRPFNRGEMRGIRSRLHGFTMGFFPAVGPGVEPRQHFGVLWALEGLAQGNPHLVMQSSVDPNPAAKVGVGPRHSLRVRDLDYGELLDSQDSVSYRVHVNPVRVSHGRRVPLRNPDAIMDWWLERVPDLGLEHSDAAFLDRDVQSLSRHGDDPFALADATIVGRGRVLDRETLLDRVSSGIGRGKSHGTGLILLAR